MSIQAAQQFRQHVNASPALQAQVAGSFVNGEVDYSGLSELGRGCGFDFSADEAKSALAAAQDELSDFEMELVSGGIVSAGFEKEETSRGSGFGK